LRSQSFPDILTGQMESPWKPQLNSSFDWPPPLMPITEKNVGALVVGAVLAVVTTGLLVVGLGLLVVGRGLLVVVLLVVVGLLVVVVRRVVVLGLVVVVLLVVVVRLVVVVLLVGLTLKEFENKFLEGIPPEDFGTSSGIWLSEGLSDREAHSPGYWSEQDVPEGQLEHEGPCLYISPLMKFPAGP